MADDLLKKKTDMLRLNFFLLFLFLIFFSLLLPLRCQIYIFWIRYVVDFLYVHSLSSSFVLKFWVHQELVKWLMSSFLNKYSKYILTSKQTSQWKPICYWNIFFDWFQRCICESREFFWVFCQEEVSVMSVYSIMEALQKCSEYNR